MAADGQFLFEFMNVLPFQRAKKPVEAEQQFDGPDITVVNLLTHLSEMTLNEGVTSLTVIAEHRAKGYVGTVCSTMVAGQMDISRVVGAMEILKTELIDEELGGMSEV